MIGIAVDFLGHIKGLFKLLCGNVIVDPDSNLSISIFSLFIFYWVIYLFLHLFHQWSHNQRR